MNDIKTRADLELLMNEFYEAVMKDEVLSPKFKDMVLENHLPVIVNFWQSSILGGAMYTGSPFDKHIPLELGKIHFTVWLDYFRKIVDKHFHGDRATIIKNKAESIAKVFMFKLGLM
ncbi:MAG: group III truncated hemoglobin [bacterium]|nr:group III truncated hemoglobin [bacterium]